MPIVRVYPTFVMPGGEVAITVRAIPGAAETCLTVMDVDLTAWLDTCGPSETRRVPFRPRKAGKHFAVLSSPGDVTHIWGSTDFCVLGEGADCP